MARGGKGNFKRKRPFKGSKGPQKKKKKKGELTKLEAIALKNKKELIRPKQESSESEDSDVELDPLQELMSTLGNQHDDDDVEDEESEHDAQLSSNSEDEEGASSETQEQSLLENHDDDDDNEEEEDEAELADDQLEKQLPDPFAHFETIIDDDLVDKCSNKLWQTREFSTTSLGKLLVHAVDTSDDVTFNCANCKDDLVHVKQNLLDNLEKTNGCCMKTSATQLTNLQKEMFHLFNNYVDIMYNERTFMNGEELRVVYCLHALNHILKTRSKIVHHTAKLKDPNNTTDEFRDQGLTRPKVLILVPFRESALRVVKTMTDLLAHEKMNVINKKRFQNEFGSNERHDPKHKKPEDYNALFAGNIDDMFRIGLSVTKKSVKLYADFYSADIIISSPLGLRIMLGAEGEKERDFDFLSSIEIMLLDQAEVFLMQNWDHVLHIFQHIHLQPLNSHGVDFSRVRMWCLNGWSKIYRQTLIFSSVAHPSLNAIFNKSCYNYSGKVRVANPVVKGTVCRVVVQLPQFFQRFSSTIAEAANVRFQTFVQKVLPEYRDNRMSHTMIFIPSYYDFVRVRNYFKKEEINFVQLCEYTKANKVARARDYFFHGKSPFLLYTERAHFYHRYLIRGVKHIIFYEMPTVPHFYSELCNRVRSLHSRLGDEADASCRVLYAQQNAQQLAAVVGTDRAQTMLSSSKQIHMFITSGV